MQCYTCFIHWNVSKFRMMCVAASCGARSLYILDKQSTQRCSLRRREDLSTRSAPLSFESAFQTTSAACSASNLAPHDTHETRCNFTQVVCFSPRATKRGSEPNPVCQAAIAPC